ncbi:AGAP008688-PB, partial [Anopheles gambiae str. PEST]
VGRGQYLLLCSPDSSSSIIPTTVVVVCGPAAASCAVIAQNNKRRRKKASSFKNGTEPNEKRIVQQIASFIIIASEIVNHACVVVGTAKTHPLHSALRQTSHAAHHGQLAKSVRASVGHDVNEGNGGEPLTVLAILDGWQRWCGGPRPPIRFGRRWSRRHDGNS